MPISQVVTLGGYTLPEKVHIAGRHLIPRLLAEHGLLGPTGELLLEFPPGGCGWGVGVGSPMSAGVGASSRGRWLWVGSRVGREGRQLAVDGARLG